jgi:hypothetical protein
MISKYWVLRCPSALGSFREYAKLTPSIGSWKIPFTSRGGCAEDLVDGGHD